MILLKLLRFWVPVVGYAGLIYWLSAQSSVEAPPLFPHADKVFHVGEYGILGWLLARAFSHSEFHLSVFTIRWCVLMITAFYGISDEFHQSFVPGRSCDWQDVFADCVGGGLGGCFYTLTNLKE